MNVIVPDPGKPDITMSEPGRAPSFPLRIAAATTWRARATTGAQDLAETLRLWPLIWTLSVLDIRLRYRGSLLGPFWLTLSTAIMVGTIGFLYSHLFHQNLGAYLPFLSISLVLWGFVSAITAEGCVCFTQSENMIRAMRMPLALHAARVVLRNIFVLAHNLVVIVVVFAIFRITPSMASFTIIPAGVLWLVDALAISLLLGIFGARFRDIPPIIGSVMQIAFYLTPIMWSPTMLAHRGLSAVLIEWNPFFDLLEIMRGPLLGNALETQAWMFSIAYSGLLVLLAGFVFARARPRIAYWV